MAQYASVLTVTVENGEMRNSGQTPYCVISVGPQLFRTRPATKTGQALSWGDIITLYLTSSDTLVQFEIKEPSPQGEGNGTSLGVASIAIQDIQAAGSQHLALPILSPNGNEQRGTLTVAFSLGPYSATKHNTAAAAAQPSLAPYSGQPPSEPAVGQPVQCAFVAPQPGAAAQPQPAPQAGTEGARQRRRRRGLVHAVVAPARAVVSRGLGIVNGVRRNVAGVIINASGSLTAAIRGQGNQDSDQPRP